jgi:hypothetical protein
MIYFIPYYFWGRFIPVARPQGVLASLLKNLLNYISEITGKKFENKYLILRRES